MSELTPYQGLAARQPSMQSLINGWIAEKAGRTGSTRTEGAYRETLSSFRVFLLERDADLNSPAAIVAPAAQVWAASSKRPGKTISNSTYNLRLSILSSFYRFCGYTMQDTEVINPIARVKRRPVQEYASASALSAGQLAGLHSMDRGTLVGMRDYALLVVALSTGRRAAELAALCKETVDGQKVIRIEGEHVTLYFKRCKGGKKTRDTLIPEAARAVLLWIGAFYGSYDAMPEGAPLWPSLSHRDRGRAIGYQTLADICEKHLNSSKVHATRHTFAHKMDEADARPTEIAGKLLHSNAATVERYLGMLKSDTNPYGPRLAALLGLEP